MTTAIPETWQLRSVESVCTRVTTGGTPSRRRPEFFENGTIPWFKTGELKDQLLLDSDEHITEEALESSSAKVFPANTVLMAMYGDGDTITTLGVLRRPAATNQACCAMMPDPDICDWRYLFYALKHTRPDLLRVVVGGAQRNLSGSIIRQHCFPLPPLQEQKAIAAVLGALDDKIELNRRMNATLEAMARALFQSWFVDFDPVRAKLDGRKPIGLDETTAALFPEHLEESPLGHIPQGWKVIGLPEAIDFLEGPGLRNWQYRDEGMKFLNIRCIGDGDLDIAKANCISLEEFEKTYRHFALQEDDIVISTSGTLGRLAIVRADHLPVMLNTSIIRMRGRGAVGLGYLWGFLQSEYFLAEMFALAAGSVQLNFGPMHLRQISILRPPDGILVGFESAMRPLLKKCLHLRKESRTLATLRDTLLPKLLSGELSLKTVSQTTEGLTTR